MTTLHRRHDDSLIPNPRTWTVVQWLGAAVATVGALGYTLGRLL